MATRFLLAISFPNGFQANNKNTARIIWVNRERKRHREKKKQQQRQRQPTQQREQSAERVGSYNPRPMPLTVARARVGVRAGCQPNRMSVIYGKRNATTNNKKKECQLRFIRAIYLLAKEIEWGSRSPSVRYFYFSVFDFRMCAFLERSSAGLLLLLCILSL